MRENGDQIVFRVLNIGIPLLLGLTIYVFLTDDTYISQLFRMCIWDGRGLLVHPDPHIMRLFRNHLCDMCWSYSMVFCVVWILGDRPFKLFTGVSVCALFSVLMEALQLSHAFPGTFDVADVILEVVSCLMAGMIIYIKLWRKKK